MNSTLTKNELRHIIKKALEPVLESPTIADVDFLADEDFMLRWSEGKISETEREQFLEHLNHNPAALLAVSEMVSSGLLDPPPAPQEPEITASVTGKISGTPRRRQRIWYYSSTVILFIVLVIAVRFLGFHQDRQPPQPEPQIARKTDPPVEQPPEPQEEPSNGASDTHTWPVNPLPSWGPPRNPVHPSWGPRSGGPTTRSHGGGGGGSLPTFNIAASPEKSVCIVRQDILGNESILTSEESAPDIVVWLIEKYRLARTEERSKDALLVILSDNDEKMEFRHSKGSIKVQTTDLEQSQKSLTRYFDTKKSPSGQFTRPK